MGLNCSHGAWDGAYSSFMRFREDVAATIGMNIDNMIGFGGLQKFDETNDLTPFLSHSDCHGVLTPDECIRTARGLGAILDELPSEGPGNSKERAIQFAKGCALAAANNEDLEFK